MKSNWTVMARELSNALSEAGDYISISADSNYASSLR